MEIEFYSLEPKLKFLDIILYHYCYMGILTGPYFKYRTYHDWLHLKDTKHIDGIDLIVKRGRSVPFILLGFILLSKYVSFKVRILFKL